MFFLLNVLYQSFLSYFASLYLEPIYYFAVEI